MRKIKKKLDILQKQILNLKKTVIAFSGGVDSTLLLKIVKDTLPSDNIIAVTSFSVLHPEFELDQTERITSEFGIKHIKIKPDLMNDKNITANTPDRCYYCKKKLFTEILKVANDNNIKYIMEGSNADDIFDFRPGMKALQELNIISPLCNAGLTKKEIRKLSKDLNIFTWNKPSLACLATRIPYGTPITLKKINRIDKCEQILRDEGFSQIRVRDHNNIARIELFGPERKKLIKHKLLNNIIKKYKKFGYDYICLDLAGYRSGSMNETLGEYGQRQNKKTS